MNQDKQSELLPCPFCGGTNITIERAPKTPSAWNAICRSRAVLCVKILAATRADAIAKWNTRPSLSTPSSPSGIENRMRWYAGHVNDRPLDLDLLAQDCSEAAETIARLESTPSEGVIERGWTIEHGPLEEPAYLTAHMAWAKDRAKALRFARQQDADALIAANGWEDFRVAALSRAKDEGAGWRDIPTLATPDGRGDGPGLSPAKDTGE